MAINRKNVLRDLVLSSSYKEYGRQTVQGILRSLLEPLMEQPSPEGLLLMKLSDTEGISSILKRLEFSDVKMYSYCDNLANGKVINITKDDIWDTTEFVLVLALRYSAVLIWDWKLLNNGMTQICLILNSREISDIANTMFDNSTIRLNEYLTTYAPDRREQKTMNIAINKIVDCLNNVNQEMVFTQAEKENYSDAEELTEEYRHISEKAKLTAHEIKNNVSVIDLYAKIIEKRLDGIELDEERAKSIKNSIESINNATHTISSFISELRSYSSPILSEKQLSSVVNDAIKLAKPKADEKGIILETFVDESYRVHIDETKMRSVLLNLIYNGIDAIEQNGRVSVKVGGVENNFVKLFVKDSGSGISEDNLDKIFEEDFTTKIDGNGMGLPICKKLMKEQYGDVKLSKTGADGTEFEVLIPVI
ncbi:MAG: HAMP domain-containing histidine kinase [Candidatus Gastranaerophilales bacterium]|nr:HAMP domain-containing histidine kinase [Candidatus Gastranaerophilales bacterium]